jgi:hypothetical protein
MGENTKKGEDTMYKGEELVCLSYFRNVVLS